MSERIKVRIQSDGTEFWRLKVTDSRTGMLLPVLWGKRHGIDLRVEDGCLVARLDLEVTEIDAVLLAGVSEHPGRAVHDGV